MASDPPSIPRSARSRANEISGLLRDEILRGQYRAGERLPSERDLAARFGCTRGAVREALKKLEQLGVVDVRPGGARVLPVAEASLDVVGHLLDLEDPPDPEIVDQVLEAMGVVMVGTIRIGIERASHAELARAASHVRGIREATEPGKAFTSLHEVARLLLEVSNNTVLGIIRRGLRTQILDRMRAAGVMAGGDIETVHRIAGELEQAIERRDSAAAAEALHALWTSHRGHVRRTLSEARSAAQTARARA